jgi:hypothetical protein
MAGQESAEVHNRCSYPRLLRVTCQTRRGQPRCGGRHQFLAMSSTSNRRAKPFRDFVKSPDAEHPRVAEWTSRMERMMIVASVVFKVSSFESSVVASALSILSREVPDSGAVRI